MLPVRSVLDRDRPYLHTRDVRESSGMKVLPSAPTETVTLMLAVAAPSAPTVTSDLTAFLGHWRFAYVLDMSLWSGVQGEEAVPVGKSATRGNRVPAFRLSSSLVLVNAHVGWTESALAPGVGCTPHLSFPASGLR